MCVHILFPCLPRVAAMKLYPRSPPTRPAPAPQVKGGIQEVALKAGASAQWLFIPMKAGKYPLRCTVKGHDAMVGTIVVNKPAAA